MTSQDSGRPGLRERKKARTRAAIQDAALRLYLKHGYHDTTVEQIADAAEVSQSTFFRYFPTKPETVLYDRLDPLFLDSFAHQPSDMSVVVALRAALHGVLGELAPEAKTLEATRMHLVADVPELRAALAQRLEADSRMFAQAVAKRVGRDADDFEVQVFVGALIGGLIAAFVGSRNSENMLELIDRSLAYMEAGLLLEPKGR